MKRKGQVEDQIAKEVTKFYMQSVGVGPRESRAYILHDMLIIRLKGKLLPIEQKLLEGKRGVELVKDIRSSLHEGNIEGMNELINKITGKKIISTHNDISTNTGEILQVFILDSNLEDELMS